MYITDTPKIFLDGAHTSNVSFPKPFITQWNLNFSTGAHFCCGAILLQFFLRAAVSHSIFEVGHDPTSATLATASWQYLALLLCTYCREMYIFLNDILKKCLKSMFITSFTWISSATKLMHNLWSIFSARK